MVDLGVSVLVVDRGRVLLTKREDFEVWCLPGGSVEAGESLGQAAIREVREETGLEIELTGLVGIYSRPSWSTHSVVFAAYPTGGALNPQVGEVVEIDYFEPNALPPALVPWYRQPIRDLLDNVRGSAVWTFDVSWPFEPGLSRAALYKLRDQSGLSRAEFFTKTLDRLGPYGERRGLRNYFII
jgi:ADP-ribose pyrophosphatase YjhB (NUDIX family)